MIKTITILIIALVGIMFAVPSFAIDTSYRQMSYYMTFHHQHMQQKKGRFIQSRDGKRTAIVPKSQKSEKVEEPKIHDATGDKGI